MFGGQSAFGGIYNAYVKTAGQRENTAQHTGHNISGVPASARQVWGIKFKFYHRLMEPLFFPILRYFAPLLLTAGSGSV